MLLTASACSGGGSAPSYPFGADGTSGTSDGTSGTATVDESSDSGDGGATPVEPLAPVIGVNVDVDHTLADPGPNATAVLEIVEPGADFIKVHFDQLQLAPGDRLYVENGAAKVVELLDDTAQPRWLGTVFGDAVTLVLVTGASASREPLHVDVLGVGDLGVLEDSGRGPISDGETSFNWCVSDDRLPTACFDGAVADRSRAVGALVAQAWGNWVFCSGWLASPANHLVTNFHCIDSQDSIDDRAADVWFDFQAKTCDGTGDVAVKSYAVDRLLMTSDPLDMSLVTLRGNPAAFYGWLDIEPRDLAVGEQVYVPQHGDGARKRVAYHDSADPEGVCRVVAIDQSFSYPGYHFEDAPGTRVDYSCDVTGGASGSPVLAASNHQVVALTHAQRCTGVGVYMRDIWPLLEPHLNDPVPPVDSGGDCSCVAGVDNFCLYGLSTPGCGMTWPGGYCDPDGNQSFDDADWQRGYAEHEAQCGAGGGGGGCSCLPGKDNFCLYGLSVPGCPMTWPGGYCDPDGNQSFDDADWVLGYEQHQAQCGAGDPGPPPPPPPGDPPGEPPCPCMGGVDNFCFYGVNNPSCPPTQPGGYCDPNGDGSFEDGDWDRGWYEYQDFCT